MSGIAEFRKYLPARISDAVSLLPQGISQTASELRLRAGMPASVTVGERNLLFDTSGRACGGANALRATRLRGRTPARAGPLRAPYAQDRSC